MTQYHSPAPSPTGRLPRRLLPTALPNLPKEQVKCVGIWSMAKSPTWGTFCLFHHQRDKGSPNFSLWRSCASTSESPTILIKVWKHEKQESLISSEKFLFHSIQADGTGEKYDTINPSLVRILEGKLLLFFFASSMRWRERNLIF